MSETSSTKPAGDQYFWFARKPGDWQWDDPKFEGLSAERDALESARKASDQAGGELWGVYQGRELRYIWLFWDLFIRKEH